MADAGKDLAKKVLPALKSGIQMAVDMFQRLSDYLAKFKTEDGFDFGKLFEDIGNKIKSAIFTALLKGIPMLMGAILAYSAGKAVLSAAFGGAKKAIASGASNLFGKMMGGVYTAAKKNRDAPERRAHGSLMLL